MAGNDDEIRHLLEMSDRLLQRAQQLADQPEDDHEVGTVITWTRTFGERTYTYAAVKYKDWGPDTANWATTTTRQNRVTWNVLWSYYLNHADTDSVFWASELTPEEW